ncbi:MAG: FkbM family methyltransferase [Myxococcales bacterium]|nr:FkbM family methyltransferase [Polyangiaceae bacterium]MDW8251479.1 FkbM family methyltransferase [Myxococcales bacterium]
MRPQRSVEVEVTRLETWAKGTGCGDVAFLKLDVQRAELDILEGAGDLLDGCLGLEAAVYPTLTEALSKLAHVAAE